MEHGAFISDIDPTVVTSYEGKVFITIDIDWAEDFVIEDTMRLLNEGGAQATILLTHDSKALSSERNFEFGIHPNFNNLLTGKPQHENSAQDIVEKLMQLVPGAKSVRSHSIVSSSPLQETFMSFGLSHDLNMFIPNGSRISLKPFFSYNSLVTVPYCWEDDAHLHFDLHDVPEMEPIDICRNGVNSLKVFNFHPIHIYLNTDTIERYEISRNFHRDESELINYRNPGYGTRNRFIDLIHEINSSL
jgi:hypothetical protein